MFHAIDFIIVVYTLSVFTVRYDFKTDLTWISTITAVIPQNLEEKSGTKRPENWFPTEDIISSSYEE